VRATARICGPRGDYTGARARYSKAFPNLIAKELSAFTDGDALAAVDLALVLQRTGEQQRAKALLAISEAYFRNVPRMGGYGYGFSDVATYALRGETAIALKRLREAERAGWRRLIGPLFAGSSSNDGHAAGTGVPRERTTGPPGCYRV